MTLDKFTIKAQEAVQAAVNTAQMNGQQVIEPVHILKGVLEKAKDVTTFIFQKLGVNAQQHKRPPRNGATNSWRVSLCYRHFSPSTPPPHAL